MPTREMGISLEGANGGHIGTTFELFKRHKTLPHPREGQTSEWYTYIPATSLRDRAVDAETSSRTSSDTSSPRTLKHASKRIGVPGLPPTPPTHSRQSSGNYQSITAAVPNYDASVKGVKDPPSVPSTPPNQKSPPTPDVTPPRNMPRLALRPRPSDRYPSSRTESFKTARENPYSSDEDEVSTVRPVLPSARPSESEAPQIPERNRRRKAVGLGLGLESDEGTTTPRPTIDSQQEFVVFDGEWGSAGDEASEVEREWDDNLMRNVTVRKRPQRMPNQNDIFPEGRTDEVLEDDIVSPTNATKVVRSLPLQERIARRRLERDAGKFGERIPWPSAVIADPESPSPDVRRFSAMSGRSITSTVIEAMVVDAPPLRQKTLRHTKKQFGLREFSSDQSSRGSAPNSVVSSEPQHRLVHKRSKIPERRHHSLASNATASTNSSGNRSRRAIIKDGGIPVVVIPDRRSSTKSSKAPSLRSTSSRKTKRSMSLNSAPLSQSSKFNEPGYFDNPPRHKRTLSESAGSGHSIRTIDFPPNIPVRRSSLSAPTSRNTSRAGSLTTSRAGSLTAESLKAHNLLQQKTQNITRLEPPQNRPSVDFHGDSAHHSRLNVDHNGDPFFGNRLSAQVTPFSQTSYETGGTAAEVSEAMAVSLYPHQNTSVLVVEQQASSAQVSRASSNRSQIMHPEISVNGKAAVGPVTPPQPIYSMDELDSPLRNPRPPPEPPAIKFIPPTPAVLTPSQEEDRQLVYVEGQSAALESIPKRGMSLVRRAFSNRRRNSEPIVKPGEGLLKRTFSLGGRRSEYSQPPVTTKPSNLYPSVADRPADGSRLHPFWRPSHFWDDLEDHDSLDDDEFGGYPAIDNRPQPPKRSLSGKLKRTFAILPITDDDYDQQRTQRRTVRRTPSGNMRVVKRRSQSLRRGEGSGHQRYIEAEAPEQRFGYGFKDGNGGRFHTIPGLGVRIEYVGWGGVKRKLSDRRRQQRSEKLRASISSPKGVQGGIDDVLRR